jgi:hypothetical protein
MLDTDLERSHSGSTTLLSVNIYKNSTGTWTWLENFTSNNWGFFLKFCLIIPVQSRNRCRVKYLAPSTAKHFLFLRLRNNCQSSLRSSEGATMWWGPCRNFSSLFCSQDISCTVPYLLYRYLCYINISRNAMSWTWCLRKHVCLIWEIFAYVWSTKTANLPM